VFDRSSILDHGEKNSLATRRRQIVAMVRRGAPLRAAARRYGVSLDTVQRWVARAAGQRLSRVDWADRSHRAHTIHRTAPATEDRILALRRELKDQSALGEFGAHAIHRTLLARREAAPRVRTIGRILERRGVLDHRQRVRRVPPPPGWYLSDVVARQAELDSWDIVEELRLPDATEIEVLTGISLHGGLISAWPGPPWTARQIVATLVSHWQELGLPAYAQFDNDNRFQGPHQHRDVVGRVMRLCLSVGVVPVFAPPREPGFQNAVEHLNGLWQRKVWARFGHDTRESLDEHSRRYVTASRDRASNCRPAGPARRPFPRAWQLDLQAPLHGHLIFLRRTGEHGAISLLGHTFEIDPRWCHRLVRCEVCLDEGWLRCFGLRRAEPESQPLLREIRYLLPKRRFRD